LAAASATTEDIGAVAVGFDLAGLAAVMEALFFPISPEDAFQTASRALVR
jgi:branched-subunit amino acid ABC-type transport system permease component